MNLTSLSRFESERNDKNCVSDSELECSELDQMVLRKFGLECVFFTLIHIYDLSFGSQTCLGTSDNVVTMTSHCVEFGLHDVVMFCCPCTTTRAS